MKTLLLAFLVASTTLSAQTLWDKAQYGASRATVLKAYPDAMRSDDRGMADAHGADLTFQRTIRNYRYAVTLHMRNNSLDMVTIRPLTAPSKEMYTDMLYSIIANHGGPRIQGDDLHRVASWTLENKQVLARAEYRMANDVPWTVVMAVRYTLAKDGPQEDGC